MNYEGEKFLLKLYRELYAKESVQHSGTISDNKYELINKYLERLQKTEKIFISENKELIKYLKKRYYDKYVIKEYDIKSNRKDTKEKIIKSQQESLDKWLDYLMKEESYPMWARYWAFQGMLKLGQYNKDTNSFSKRSKKTTSPFIELNKEALNKTMDLLIEAINSNNLNDEILNKLIENGNFGRIYAYNIKKQIEKDKENNVETGIWKTYRYNEAKKLANDISEKNTGWCITSETISKNYLDYGTMYIYYTKDQNGNYTIPRICIRKEDINVAEVKGILNKDNNLEYEMLDIAIEKIDQIHNGDKFKRIANDMKQLTEIIEKHDKNIILSTEELRFLYEIDKEIGSFTYQKDSRIKKIINERNIKEDLSRIFNCSINQVGIEKEDLTKKDMYVYYGSITYNKDENIIMPPVVVGTIYLDDNTTIKGFENLKLITGSLIGDYLLTAENLTSLEQINRNLETPKLKSAKGLENLKKVGGTVKLQSLTGAKGLYNLKETGNLIIKNVRTSEGLENLEIVRGNLDISNMIDLSHLESLKLIERNIICYASNSLNDMLHINIKGDIHFYHMINIHNLFGRKRTR